MQISVLRTCIYAWATEGTNEISGTSTLRFPFRPAGRLVCYCQHCKYVTPSHLPPTRQTHLFMGGGLPPTVGTPQRQSANSRSDRDDKRNTVIIIILLCAFDGEMYPLRRWTHIIISHLISTQCGTAKMYVLSRCLLRVLKFSFSIFPHS